MSSGCGSAGSASGMCSTIVEPSRNLCLGSLTGRLSTSTWPALMSDWMRFRERSGVS